MKRIFLYFSMLALVATGTVSCSKFLERPPEGQLTEEELFRTEADVVAFSNGVYTLVGDGAFYGGRQFIMAELLGDHYRGDFFTGDFSEIYRRQNSIFGGTRDGYYRKAYDVIGRANIILGKLDMATTKRDQLEGEAKFFRALSHFEMVRMFAQPWGFTPDNSHLGVPLRTQLDLGSIPRSTVAQVYAQIITDLIDAGDKLPDVPENGLYYTATKWAAKALLAKVYFQQNDFAKAFASANEVIESLNFALDADYTARYSTGESTESILAIANLTGQYDVAGELRGNFRSDVGLPNFRFTNQFYTTANARAADRRKVWYSNTVQAGFNLLTKYNKNNFDMPVIHLTEIMLIRAEAGAELGGASLATAITDINTIMTRAYGGPTFNLPPTATASLVIANARNERELELVGEGNRVHEIKRIGARTGQNIDRRGSVWTCNGFILQFPKAELDAFPGFVMNVEGGCF